MLPLSEPRGWPGVTSREIEINGVRLHYVEAGPPGGSVVVLLHGFPEFCFSWRLQIPALAAAGFRVIAPDLRGYNASSKPPSVRDYRIERLVADVAGLIDHVGGRAAVVGHDWGGVVAWYTAMAHPERIPRLAILNAPHPAAYVRELRRPAQLLRSWYVMFFQLPWLPEAAMRWDDFALPRRLFARGPARVSPRKREDVRRYVRALAAPGALSATINYYRAAGRMGPNGVAAKVRIIRAPTLLLWGEQDEFLVRELTEGLEMWVPALRVEHLGQATHWAQHDEPERVNELLVEFLKEEK